MGIFLQVIFLLLLSQAVQPIAKAAFSEYEDDRKALLAFKAGLSDHSGTLSSWNQRNADFCRWEGVTCHNTSQPPRVSAVTLPSRGLTGTISPVVGNLSFLQSLNLSPNQLGGEIPATIGFLHHLGYLNLEYGVGGEVSTSGDVYSFGIVLLEMIIGKAPTDEMFRDGLSLHSFAAAALLENLLRAVDPVLLPRQSVEVSGCLSAVVGIGVSCSKQLLSDRMSIASAAAELRALKDAYLSSVH